MKKYIILIIGLIIFSKSFSQFSTKVEYEYLKLLNNGSPKSLHQDNFRNAELVFDSLTLKPNDSYGSLFLKELAESYSYCGEEEHAIYTSIRQLTLFPDDTINTESQKILRLNMLKEGFSIKQIEGIISEISGNKSFTGFEMSIMEAFKLGFDELDSKIKKLINQVNTFKLSPNSNIILQVEYLLEIHVGPKHRNQFEFTNSQDLNSWKSKLVLPLFKQVIKTEIKYFRKLENKPEFRNCVAELHKLNFKLGDRFFVLSNRLLFIF